jgi:hypothetical protein
LVIGRKPSSRENQLNNSNAFRRVEPVKSDRLLVEADPGLRLPSDLSGLTTLRYRARIQDEMERTIALACDDIRKHIDYHGVRRDRQNR